MLIVPATTPLNAAGFETPLLNALIPNENNYSVLLLQPSGEIEASASHVRNMNRALAAIHFSAFLNKALSVQADFAVTPEYSTPWETLKNFITANKFPSLGKLWVLGCESIKYSELELLKQELSPHASLIYETLQADDTKFLDPLAYIFQAPVIGQPGQFKLVVLIQFKTYPMGDADHFEINNLQRGTQIFQFGGNQQQIKLVSIICSDAFQFTDAHANSIYDRALIVHIQLNSAPRNQLYSQYRQKLFRFQGTETELLCLNWACGVVEWQNGQSKPWNNIAGSAWYLKPDRFDQTDATLSTNHRRGMYYTWSESLRTHVLFFNYEPAVFFLQASKVSHIGVVGPVSPRRGPQLTNKYIWDNTTSDWKEQGVANDGFASFVQHSNSAQHELGRITLVNPFATERILALCAGEIGHKQNWHSLQNLDSCKIDLTEVIHRITFCQDTDQQSQQLRIGRLIRCGRLWNIILAQFPPSLTDFQAGFSFDWRPSHPHQNAISSGGRRATLIYLGEDATPEQVEKVFKFAAEFLHRSSSNLDESREARQRLAVWYRNGSDQIILFDGKENADYSNPAARSEFDIGRES